MSSTSYSNSYSTSYSSSSYCYSGNESDDEYLKTIIKKKNNMYYSILFKLKTIYFLPDDTINILYNLIKIN